MRDQEINCGVPAMKPIGRSWSRFGGFSFAVLRRQKKRDRLPQGARGVGVEGVRETALWAHLLRSRGGLKQCGRVRVCRLSTTSQLRRMPIGSRCTFENPRRNPKSGPPVLGAHLGKKKKKKKRKKARKQEKRGGKQFTVFLWVGESPHHVL